MRLTADEIVAAYEATLGDSAPAAGPATDETAYANVLATPEFHRAFQLLAHARETRDTSDAALNLTSACVTKNESSFSAWHWRRKALEQRVADSRMRGDLSGALEMLASEQRDFCEKWTQQCVKNYQVWTHRRWLVDAQVGLLRDRSAAGELSSEEVDERVEKLVLEELVATLRLFRADRKVYNIYGHRQHLVEQHCPSLWAGEESLAETLIEADVRNASAWNLKVEARYQAWRHARVADSVEVHDVSEREERALLARDCGASREACWRRNAHGLTYYAVTKLSLATQNEACWNTILALLYPRGCLPNSSSFLRLPPVDFADVGAFQRCFLGPKRAPELRDALEAALAQVRAGKMPFGAGSSEDDSSDDSDHSSGSKGGGAAATGESNTESSVEDVRETSSRFNRFLNEALCLCRCITADFAGAAELLDELIEKDIVRAELWRKQAAMLAAASNDAGG